MSRGRRSSNILDIQLLSLLATAGRLSGYEFAALLAEPVALVWPVRHSQIYPALASLEERGDIVGTWIDQTGRPNKKQYAISPDGAQRLKEWLLQPRDKLSEDEAMLISYNLALVGCDAVAAALLQYRKQCTAEIAQFEERWLKAITFHEDEADVHVDRDLKLAGVRSLYEHAIHIRNARIAWCDTALSQSLEIARL